MRIDAPTELLYFYGKIISLSPDMMGRRISFPPCENLDFEREKTRETYGTMIGPDVRHAPAVEIVWPLSFSSCEAKCLQP